LKGEEEVLESIDTTFVYVALGFSVAAILISFHLQREVHRLRAWVIKLELERGIYNESNKN
jgi:hypothetical protein